MKLSSLCLSEKRRQRSCQIGGLRVEVLESYLSKNQTTGEVKIREVMFELLREVGFGLGHKLRRPLRASFFVFVYKIYIKPVNDKGKRIAVWNQIVN